MPQQSGSLTTGLTVQLIASIEAGLSIPQREPTDAEPLAQQAQSVLLVEKKEGPDLESTFIDRAFLQVECAEEKCLGAAMQ